MTKEQKIDKIRAQKEIIREREKKRKQVINKLFY